MSAESNPLFPDGARIFEGARPTRLAAVRSQLRGTQSIICRQEGFTVRTERFWRCKELNYRWDQVGWTEYKWLEAGPHAGATFVIFAGPLPALYLREAQIGDLAGLIEIFNAMTPQLDHTWEATTENVATGGADAPPRGRFEYVYRPGRAPWERAIAEDPSNRECCRCATPARHWTPEGPMCEICYIESR